MKKLFFMLIAAVGAVSATAQESHSTYSADSMLPRWVIDINLLGGGASQTYTTNNSAANYLNSVNTNTGDLKFRDGWSYGADAQVGFFFGKKRHFGIGTGFMFMEEQGNAVLQNYHVEYQATDGSGNTFRQLVTGNNVKEAITSTNMNIPIVLKYKNRFSKRWGFAADAGAVINLQMKNDYVTHAAFDYEAIYRLKHNDNGTTTSVYDNSPTPLVDDWFITKAEFLKNNANGNLQDYFNAKRELGYNVGEGIAPNGGTGKGSVSYMQASVGLLLRPSFNYFLSDNAALSFGLYYMFQPFKNDAQTGYKLMDGSSNYSSVLNSVTATNNHTYGLNVGARFFLGRKDRDHDGVPDRKDKCPDVYGLAKFDGCPDTDGDGIPDKEDSCVTIPGLAQFHGCPDTDGDGIPDKDDACPYNAGPVALHGCPDRDGDGIIDRDDLCPDVFGLVAFHGCPDRDGDGVPDKDDRCPDVAGPISNQGCPLDTVKTLEKVAMDKIDMSTPIKFDLNKATVHTSSYPIIDEAVIEIKENKGSSMTIDGNADTTGRESWNRVLSLMRANSVKNELVKRGVSPKRIKTKGHGSRVPAATNETAEGRQQNRRAVMTLRPSNK